MSNATHVAKIEETVARQRAFFQTGATRPVAVRVAALKRLKKEIQAREQILLDALQACGRVVPPPPASHPPGPVQIQKL